MPKCPYHECRLPFANGKPTCDCLNQKKIRLGDNGKYVVCRPRVGSAASDESQQSQASRDEKRDAQRDKKHSQSSDIQTAVAGGDVGVPAAQQPMDAEGGVEDTASLLRAKTQEYTAEQDTNKKMNLLLEVLDDESGGETDAKVEESPDIEEAHDKVIKAEKALYDNLHATTDTKMKLMVLNDRKAQKKEIDHNVASVATETRSQSLANFLGDMWKDMRMFATPFYKEHLAEKLEDPGGTGSLSHNRKTQKKTQKSAQKSAS